MTSAPRPQAVSSIGLDRAGKSVILNYFTTGIILPELKPTLAINYSSLILMDLALKISDNPGQKSLRRVWLQNLKRTEVIIFTVDTADHIRFEESKSELIKVLKSPDTQGIPMLFLFNKMDLQEAKDNIEFARTFFKCDEMAGREVHFFETTIQNKASLDAVKDKMYKILKAKFAV